MKNIYLVIPLCMLFQVLKTQSLEIGLARNYTHLTQSTARVYWTDRNDRARLSLYARYQQTKGFFLFRNNELGIDVNSAYLGIETQSSPGGAGGQDLYLNYSALSFTLNNYLLNYRIFKKQLQLGLGIHSNYKLASNMSGGYTDSKIGWNSSGVYFTWYQYNFSKSEQPYIRKFNLGLCATAGTVFNLDKHQFSIRYCIQRAIIEDVTAPNGIGVSYLRQTLGLYIVRR